MEGQAQLYLPYTKGSNEGLLEVVRINCAHRRTWFIGDSTIDSAFRSLDSYPITLSWMSSIRADTLGGTILLQVPIDPLFLVIPIILSLLPTSSTSIPFQPFSDLVAQVSASAAFALPEPFASTVEGKGGWNEDVGRLLARKSMRRVMKLTCERKGESRPDPASLIWSDEAPTVGKQTCR
jgi:ribonuclease H2 subunit B